LGQHEFSGPALTDPALSWPRAPRLRRSRLSWPRVPPCPDPGRPRLHRDRPVL